MKLLSYPLAVLLLLLSGSSAFAAEVIDTGDTAWIIVATALVMVMTPAGLALFYGGMSRYKNLLNTYAMTFVAYCLGSVVWVMWGYSLAFGPDVSGIVGGLNHAFLAGIGVDSVSGTIPTLVFVVFQMTFAAITVALVLGSVVDRMKFSSWIVFTILWLTFIYSPIAHWVWGGGWMGAMGALDFAGGTVVHINAGVAGLVLSYVVGKRLGYGKTPMFPSSVSLTALGAALLWFGWFRLFSHQHLCGDGSPGLDGCRMADQQKADPAGHRLGRRCRPGGHYPCRRLRRPDLFPDNWRGGRRTRFLQRGHSEKQNRLRRFA